MNEIKTDLAPAALGPYSQGIQAGGLLFTSGQIPADPETGALVGRDIETQAGQALANLRAVLRAAGADLSNVVKTTVYLRDMGDFAVFNQVYAAHFSAPYPARSCVQAGRLPKDALVEIEAMAVL